MWATAPEEGDIGDEGTIDFGDATRWQAIRRYWQDEFEPVQRVQDAIGDIPDDANVRRKLRLYQSQVQAEQEKFEKWAKARLEKLLGEDLTIDDAHRYLWAKHAGERNAWLYKQEQENGGTKDMHPESNPASGMRSSVATKLVREIESGPLADRYKRISSLMQGVNKKRIRKLSEAGLLSPEFLAAIEAQGYEHYMPLKHSMKNRGKSKGTGGRGFEVDGQEGKRARGRRSEPDNVLINALTDYETALLQIAKNEVGNRLLKLVEANPDKDLWQVYEDKPRIEPSDTDPGVMRQLWDMREDWHGLSYRVYNGGSAKTVVFNRKGADLARSLGRTDVEALGAALRFLGPITRYLAKINTSYNPAFIPVNFLRDIQTAGVVLYEEHGARAAIKVTANAPAMIRAIVRSELGKDSEAGQYWERMKAAGGRTSFYVGKTWEEVRDNVANLEAEMRVAKTAPEKAMKWARGFAEVVRLTNDAVENGVRLAAFKYAVEEMGMNDEQAAELAKTLTIDFNVRGENRWLSSLYMFANASIQGSARMAKTLALSKKGRVMAASLMGLGALVDMLNRMLAPDDDDGENAWDAVPEWKRDRYWMLYTGMGENGFLSFPLPYGFSTFYSMGRNASSAVAGGTTPAEAAINIASSAATSFSPIGDAHNLSWVSAGRLISPTAFDPVIELAANEDYRGSSIRRESLSFDRTPDPASHTSWANTPEVYKNAAQLMNAATGGGRLESGLVDISPDTLRYIAGVAGGGLFRTADRTLDTAATAFTEGDPVTAFNRAPFVRQFFAEESERKGYYSYRDNSDEVLRYAHIYDGYANSEDEAEQERAAELYEEVGPVIELAGEVKLLEQIRKRMQKEIAATTDDDERARLEVELYAEIRAFNRMFQEAKNQ